MIPYVPTTKPMTGEEQEALVAILQLASWNTPSDRLRLANRIIEAGFARRVPQKVSKLQLWSYASETFLLASFALTVFSKDLPFVFGGLVALTIGSLLTFIGALIINHSINKETNA